MGQTINKQDGIMVKVSMSLNIIQHKHKVASSLRTHSPVGWPRCRRLRCWPGSTGPRPWRARSSGASRRGRPRSCRRGGRSSRSAPGPAGEEARLVTRSAALRDSDQAVQWLHASFYFSLRFLFKVTIRHQKKKNKERKAAPWFAELSLFFTGCFWSSVSSLAVWRFAVLENCIRTK